MSKPTFLLMKPDGTAGERVEYTPLMVEIGNCDTKRSTELLALHRPTAESEWRVSDPKSGAQVLVVRAWFKGCIVSSASLTLAEARDAAKSQVAALALQTGVGAFRATLQAARARREGLAPTTTA